MKNLFLLLVSLLAQNLMAATDKTPVSVTSFQNKSASSYSEGSACHHWSWFSDLGDAFSDILLEELEKHSQYEVLERNKIQSIYANEVDLINSEENKSIKKGRFKKAKITFVGVVDGFEFCQEGTGIAVDVGSILGIGNVVPSVKTSNATISLMIRAIDTTTGKVLATARSKKNQERQSVGFDIFIKGVSASTRSFKQSILGETIREAVEDAADQLVKKL